MINNMTNNVVQEQWFSETMSEAFEQYNKSEWYDDTWKISQKLIHAIINADLNKEEKERSWKEFLDHLLTSDATNNTSASVEYAMLCKAYVNQAIGIIVHRINVKMICKALGLTLIISASPEWYRHDLNEQENYTILEQRLTAQWEELNQEAQRLDQMREQIDTTQQWLEQNPELDPEQKIKQQIEDLDQIFWEQQARYKQMELEYHLVLDQIENEPDQVDQEWQQYDQYLELAQAKLQEFQLLTCNNNTHESSVMSFILSVLLIDKQNHKNNDPEILNDEVNLQMQ